MPGWRGLIAMTRMRAWTTCRKGSCLSRSRYWPHKNHVSLVRAIAMLSAEGLRVPLVFTGKRTPTAVVIDQTIQELDLVGQVTWMGFVEPQTLRAVYGRATAVVIPSRFEAASAPLWEAFSAGVPAACSRVTSLPRQAGDAALLFEPDRVDQIAAAIRQLWTDVSLRRQLIEKGRQQVAPFTWDRTARLFRATTDRSQVGPYPRKTRR